MPQVQDKSVFGSAVGTSLDPEDVARQLVDDVAASLDGRSPHVCLLFASAHFEDGLSEIAGAVADALPTRAMIGVTGETVVHDNQELENQPAVTLWAAYMPGVKVTSFHLSQSDLERLEPPEAFQDYVSIDPLDQPYFITAADPYSINAQQLLDRLNSAYPGRPVVGGLASGAERAGQNSLVFDGHTLHHGAVGIALWGALRIDTVVSQGCRPIAEPMVITKAQRNVIHELGGKRAKQVFRSILDRCPVGDVTLAREKGMLIGRVIDESKTHFGRGDFLMRQFRLVPNADAILINDQVRAGQTIQFHVQDAESAAEDLESLLRDQSAEPAAGALLFTCNGRGTHLFNHRNHDARSLVEAFGSIPVAGISCAGEIGPVGSRNFLHGHTASIALFRPSDEPDES